MHQVVWGPCPACRGTGKPIADVGGCCGGCNGAGWVIGHETRGPYGDSYFWHPGPPPKTNQREEQ
jgi:hypothetical protein